MPRFPHVLFLCLAAVAARAEDASPKPDAGEPVEQLSAFVVMAGRIPMGASPGAILNSVEVISTPGATADINRSLQTFPGVQQVDEGNALFVRGGDSSETALLINGVRYASSTRINAPTGTFSTSLDPMEARSITFLNGGLAAQYGNALSGIVDLTTRGAPNSSNALVNLGLGAVEASQNLAFGHQAGVRLTGTLSSTAPIFGLNGSREVYEQAPQGHNLSAAGAWAYRSGGEVRTYVLDQETKFGLWVDEPDLRGLYRYHARSQLATASWEDQVGAWKWSLDAGSSNLWRQESTPLGTIITRDAPKQMNLLATYDVSGRMALTSGVNLERDGFFLEKSKDAAGVLWDFRRDLDDTRSGVFAQLDTVVVRHVRAIVGGRTDRSGATRRRTTDPRLSLVWEPRRDLSFSVAGGSYHQIPDAYYFFNADGSPATRPAMRAQDAIAAVEYRNEHQLLRVEAYKKHYGALAQMDRDHMPVAGSGRGEARGVDLFFKTDLPADFSGRITCSFLKAERTDPDSGIVAPAPWDIRESLTVILQRPVAGWNMSVAWHYASGKPVTPVTGGVPDGAGGWNPVYGTPYSARLPVFQRLDYLAYRVWLLESGRTFTTYISVNNLLNRTNSYNYTYSSDYSARRIVPSLFNRILYFGVMFNFN